MKKQQKDVQLAKQREQDPTNLYFANLPIEVDEKCLTEMLQNKFKASVSSTRIMRERSGASKGVGFARIDDNSLCDTIIKDLHNKPFPEHANKTKLLLVKLADSGGSLLKVKPNGMLGGGVGRSMSDSIGVINQSQGGGGNPNVGVGQVNNGGALNPKSSYMNQYIDPINYNVRMKKLTKKKFFFFLAI